MAENLGPIWADLRLRLSKLNEDLAQARTKLQEADKTLMAFGKRFEETGERVSKVGKDLTTKVTGPIVGLGAASVMTVAKFDEAMSKVAAVSSATGGQLAKLREQAKELGATTQFSASEAAAGMEFLARAGFEVDEIYSAMPGMLNLAAAGALDLGRAADITSNIMSGFSMEASEAARVADVLAKTAASANTNVEQMGEAMKYVAPVAAGLGISLEETAAAIGILGDAGIQASMAGTTLRRGLLNLSAPTNRAAAVMKELGLQVFDAEGKMRPLREIIAQLEEGMKGYTEQQKTAALSTLFGAEAVSGWMALLQRGSEDLANFTTELENSSGTSEEMAKIMMDNLSGALKELKSALEGAAIAFGEVLEPTVRKVSGRITELVRWFTGLDEQTKKTIVTIAAIAAAIGPVIFITGKLITTIGSLIKIASLLGKSLIFLATNPIGQVILAIGALIAIGYLLYKNWDKIKAKAAEVWKAVIGWFVRTEQAAIENWDKIKTKAAEVWKAIVDWFSRTKQAAIDLGRGIVDGLISVVEQLPQKVWGILMKVNSKITGAAGRLWNSAKRAASSIWDGFKRGLGISSPSYIEEALDRIMKASRSTVSQLHGDFERLSRLTVQPQVASVVAGTPVATSGLGTITDGLQSLVKIEKMEVRRDEDIQLISRELYRLIQSNSRGRGLTLPLRDL